MFSSTLIIKNIGIQFLAWGIIDGLIAIPSLKGNKHINPKRLAKILYFNGFLDIGYITIGVLLILLKLESEIMIGNGIGVVIQGLFLFISDFYFGKKAKMLKLD